MEDCISGGTPVAQGVPQYRGLHLWRGPRSSGSPTVWRIASLEATLSGAKEISAPSEIISMGFAWGSLIWTSLWFLSQRVDYRGCADRKAGVRRFFMSCVLCQASSLRCTVSYRLFAEGTGHSQQKAKQCWQREHRISDTTALGLVTPVSSGGERQVPRN